MPYTKNIFKVVLFSLLLTFFATSCSDEDNPVASQVEHFEAEGMVFRESGIKIADIFQGETTTNFTVEEGESSAHIEVTFYDTDKNEIDPPADEDKLFSWEIADTGIAKIWQHEGEEGSYEFHIQGVEHGTTTVEFFVKHGDHNDYRSGEITIVVDHGEEEYDAEGMVFYTSGIKIAEIFQGVTSDTLFADAGTRSDHIEVKFYDDNQQEMDPPADEHHTLAWEIADTNIADIWQHEGEEGGFEFHIDGKTAGTTEIEFFIAHEGHNDFRSGKMVLTVR